MCWERQPRSKWNEKMGAVGKPGSVAHCCPGTTDEDQRGESTPTAFSNSPSLVQSLELFRFEGNHFTRTKQWVISPILHSNSQSPKHFNAMTGYEKKYLFQ